MGKLLIVIALAVLLALVLYLAYAGLYQRPEALPQTTSSWLSQQNESLAGTPAYPTLKAGELLGISYGNIASASENRSGAAADLGMLYDANVTAIRIDLNYGPWIDGNATQISTYDAFVYNISANNKTLIIADAAAEYYRQHQLPWSQFKAAWVQRVAEISARYHPAYYIVVKEPPWYFPMISGSPLLVPFNASDWANLTAQLAAAVKRASPDTQVGVAVSGDVYHQQRGPLDLQYLEQVEKIQNVSFIGFDVYGPTAWNDTQRFIDTYGAGGKQVWIAETWSSTSTQLFNQSREALDSQWISTVYLFAESLHAQYIVPFFTNLFASYRQTANGTYIPASFYQNRTPAFYAYKNITPINNP